MALVQRGAGDLDWVVQVAAVLFLFVLPALRSLAESRKTREQKRARRAAGEPPARPRPRRERELEAQERDLAQGESGRELFERLLRGERPAQAAPAPPAPPPAPRPPPLVLRPEAVSLEEAPPPPLVQLDSLPGVPGEELLERGAVAQTAQQLVHKALAPSFPDQLGSSLEVLEEVAEHQLAARRRVSAFELRRGIVLAEVLAPPLALRPPGSAAGAAPGLG